LKKTKKKENEEKKKKLLKEESEDARQGNDISLMFTYLLDMITLQQ